MNYNKSRNLAIAFSLSILFTAPVVLADNQAYELEPCINGGVSATGMYPSQVIEDAALSDINVAESWDIPGSDFTSKQGKTN